MRGFDELICIFVSGGKLICLYLTSELYISLSVDESVIFPSEYEETSFTELIVSERVFSSVESREKPYLENGISLIFPQEDSINIPALSLSVVIAYFNCACVQFPQLHIFLLRDKIFDYIVKIYRSEKYSTIEAFKKTA